MAWVEGNAAESTMRFWFTKFRSGDFGLEDEEGRGQNPDIDNDQLMALVESNPQATMHELPDQLNVSILTISLYLNKISKVKKQINRCHIY